MVDDVAQRLAELQQQVNGLRVLLGAGIVVFGALWGAALMVWSRGLRRMDASIELLEARLAAVEAHQAAQSSDVSDAGMYAREELARRRLRVEARRLRRCGTGAGTT